MHFLLLMHGGQAFIAVVNVNDAPITGPMGRAAGQVPRDGCPKQPAVPPIPARTKRRTSVEGMVIVYKKEVPRFEVDHERYLLGGPVQFVECGLCVTVCSRRFREISAYPWSASAPGKYPDRTGEDQIIASDTAKE
jgi:hypothetical protein